MLVVHPYECWIYPKPPTLCHKIPAFFLLLSYIYISEAPTFLLFFHTKSLESLHNILRYYRHVPYRRTTNTMYSTGYDALLLSSVLRKPSCFENSGWCFDRFEESKLQCFTKLFTSFIH